MRKNRTKFGTEFSHEINNTFKCLLSMKNATNINN